MDVLKKIENLSVDFLELLGIEATISSEIGTNDNGGKYINLEIEGNELSELVGYHGQMLDSIQNILSLMSRDILGDDYHLVIDINGYKKERVEYIKSLTEKAILNVKENSQEVVLSPMRPFERRIVHITVQEDGEVTSESSGENSERYVVIKLK